MKKLPISEIKFEMAIDSPEQLESWLEQHDEIKGFCFAGRSNVGKSSLINSIFGRKTARTSKTPGRTKAINIFSFSKEPNKTPPEFYFFDIPGYGYAKASKQEMQQWKNLMDILFELFPSQMVLIQIQDARHPFQQADQIFSEYIREFNINPILVFNKIDKLTTQKERSELKKQLKLEDSSSSFQVSAESGDGLNTLMKYFADYLFS